MSDFSPPLGVCLQIHMTPDAWSRVIERANGDGISVSSLIEHAIRHYHSGAETPTWDELMRASRKSNRARKPNYWFMATLFLGLEEWGHLMAEAASNEMALADVISDRLKGYLDQ